MHANQANKKDVRDKLSRLFLYQIQGEKPIQPAAHVQNTYPSNESTSRLAAKNSSLKSNDARSVA